MIHVCSTKGVLQGMRLCLLLMVWRDRKVMFVLASTTNKKVRWGCKSACAIFALWCQRLGVILCICAHACTFVCPFDCIHTSRCQHNPFAINSVLFSPWFGTNWLCPPVLYPSSPTVGLKTVWWKDCLSLQEGHERPTACPGSRWLWPLIPFDAAVGSCSWTSPAKPWKLELLFL